MPMFDIRKDINLKFLKYYLRSPLFRGEVSKIAPKGTAQKAIHEDKLLKISVYFPTKEYQTKICKLIEFIEEIVALNKSSLDLLSPLMDSILFKELSGKD